MSSSVPDARTEVPRRLAERRAASARHARTHLHIANARLGLFLLGALLTWAAIGVDGISPAWVLVPIAGFFALVALHERVARARVREDRAATFYERAQARLDDRWSGTGEPGDRFRDPAHLYAEDLDLFGRGGLFELLSVARTPRGEETLARWLLAPATPEVVRERQTAVADLRGRVDFREDLAVIGEAVRAEVRPEALLAWAEEPPVLVAPRARAAAAILVAITLASAAVWWATGWRVPLLASAVVQIGFAFRLRARVVHVVEGVRRAAHDLAHLARFLERIEEERCVAPRLLALRAALDNQGAPPSHRIAALSRLVEALESRENQIVAVLGPAVLFTTQIAFALEAWRVGSGAAVRRWLDAVGELEALASLALYAYERPEDPFPAIAPAGAPFVAEGLGHPLLPADGCVRNDLRLGADLHVLVVSGSNMSGKSTLLRSAGTAAVMAMAGAPVRAKRLSLPPLAVGASIRVTDSLQGGSSRFYAEITRLRKILDLTGGPWRVLFLLDELLNGTNSHDRRLGAEGIVRGLIARGAFGLVTTHDLALTQIADALAPRGANVHFEDHLEGGALRFDYLMRPGIVQKSNALELMRSVGLEV